MALIACHMIPTKLLSSGSIYYLHDVDFNRRLIFFLSFFTFRYIRLLFDFQRADYTFLDRDTDLSASQFSVSFVILKRRLLGLLETRSRWWLFEDNLSFGVLWRTPPASAKMPPTRRHWYRLMMTGDTDACFAGRLFVESSKDMLLDVPDAYEHHFIYWHRIWYSSPDLPSVLKISLL